jgi:hypothetical protein
VIAVSKIDKYDKGIGDKLQGIGPGSMVLKLGCVAVLNRSPEEIEEDISFDEMRQREAQFFRSHHQAFENVPEQYLGSGKLVKRLASIQQERIRSTLPTILDELKTQIKAKKAEFKQLPTPVSSETDGWALYTNLIKNYRETIQERVQGVYNNDLQLQNVEPISTTIVPVQSVTTAPTVTNSFDDRIAYQLYTRQKKCSDIIHNLFPHFFTEKYQKIILKLLEENAGVALPNFPTFSIIERLYRAEQKKFQKPCEDLIESFAEYLKKVLIKILHDVFHEETSYKDNMIHKLTDIIIRAIDKSEEKCSNDVNKMLEMEQRVFTLNHYYMDTVNKIKQKVPDYIEKKKAGK